MGTANINGKLIVDVDPNIVAAADTKTLTILVNETGMKFIAEMMVAATSSISWIRVPTRFARYGIIIGGFRSTLIVQPTFRSILTTSPSKNTIFRRFACNKPGIKTKGLLDKRSRNIAIAKIAFTTKTLVPSGAIAEYIYYRNTFGRIKRPKRLTQKRRSFSLAFCSGSRHRILARSRNIIIRHGFYGEEPTYNRRSLVYKSIGVEVPPAICHTGEGHVKMTFFVHALRIVEQLIKELFFNKALLASSRQLGLFRCRIQRRFDDTRGNTNASLNGRYRHRGIDTLCTLLATFSHHCIT